jgi:hypothetical protein
MASLFAKTAPYEWRRARRESSGSSKIMSNMARILGENSGLMFASSNTELLKPLPPLSKGGRSNAGSSPARASKAPSQNADSRADTRSRGSIVVSCSKEGAFSVCRPSGGKMVWCKGRHNLSSLEAEVAKSPRDNVIRETGSRWGCGGSAAAGLLQHNRPLAVIGYHILSKSLYQSCARIVTLQYYQLWLVSLP